MLIFSVLAFFIFIFLLATVTVAVAWMGFVKRTSEQNQAERGDVGRPLEGAGEQELPLPEPPFDLESPLFRNERLSTLDFWNNLLARFDFVEILKSRLEEAELDWSVGRVTLAMLLLGTLSAIVGTQFVSVWVALAAGALTACAPYAHILRLREKRFKKFREGFPDVLDSLARALRAGYPLSAAMDIVGGEAPMPIAAEIKRAVGEANLGMGWPRAMENFGKRVPLVEVNLFAAAVTLHARTGGKLSEVMSGLAENMRESNALQGEVHALAAHGKLTGMILTVLPFGIATMMFFVSPGYMDILFDHPWGMNLIAAAVICLVLAHFVIRKLVDIKP